jgi:FO synthase
VHVQAPPNLSPGVYQKLIDAGLNDWGGVSPVTPDHVNPEAPWPHVEKLADTCASEGFTLLPRLPIYPEFIEQEGFLDPALRSAVVAEQERLAIGVATMAPSPLAVAEGTHA